MDTYVAFDLETTGFSPVSNEILEIGAWLIKDDVAVSKFSELVKPKGYIPLDIQKMTHIYPDMVSDARDIEEVLPEFFEWCGNYPMLSHNLNFDFSFIFSKGKEMGYDFSLNGERLGICTLKLSRDYFPDKGHKLGDMADAFNIRLSSPNGNSFHRAEYDAYMVKLLYDRFKFLYPALDAVNTPTKVLKDYYKYGVSQTMGSLPLI